MTDKAPAKKAAKKTPTPKPLETTVSFSFGFTRQIQQFEPVKVQIDTSQKFDVSGMNPEAIAEFRKQQLQLINDEVMTAINAEYQKLGG